MKIKLIPWVIATLILAGCQGAHQPATGSWLAELMPDTIHPEIRIPFNLEIIHPENQGIQARINNAGEEIIIREIEVSGDSIHFQLPVFEGSIDARFLEKHMEGTYTHRAGGRSWTIPFLADFGVTDRFPRLTGDPSGDISGRWEVQVGSGDQTEKQIGEFVQNGSHLTGTFLTTTGDYRYLEGKVAGTRMMLSAFDGAHALVFSADLLENGSLGNGSFCGGPSWNGTWSAIRNDTASLPDPTTLTFLKPGYTSLDFSFPDLLGKQVSLQDPRFQGKPLIVQIIGSWCPNCMDETRYLTALQKKYKTYDLNIIALCYESSDFDQSVKAIARFKEAIGAGYIFLYAGESNKRKASETLPMLNRILSFPTSIFINRSGEIEKIFTGFSGPGTGQYYEDLTREMEETVMGMVGR